jgi:YHS domain-containing protein
VIRFAVLVAVVFLFVGLVRVARPSFEKWRSKSAARPVEADLVRDPVCGTWVDRRIALSGRSGGEAVSVCSEKCRRLLESA